ncbi:MAG TPA: 7TM diverse intracellular signaling domain-containing protein [Flavobacteriaceae bacterium]|nr:hypothetical protein [Flavobacteriaceae bacterium]MCB9214216.1 hypothetical protein [Alteromonas sp.]HPF10706.1 7TM diverse intracellular signaling domain-containing protein [Flavobacteriaceae bacterium]HQU21949.1 7TM diverse intracellular signaling domain-containing protein [Flavobacteriaceae bacterium]HRW43179.1 7TM diverse intracellular signaling domain-containing protein [Flavobacteriaceae bacterium]
MRLVLLFLALTLCTSVQAKKKTYMVEINTKGVALKSIEKSILSEQTGVEFNGPNSMMNPSLYMTPVDGTFYFDNNFLFFDHFYNGSEFSYKNNGGSTSTFLLNYEDASTIREKASTDSSTLFRQGMFYGFTIMLVLLNLACFFLFDEKPYLLFALSLAAASLLFFFSDGLFTLMNFELTHILSVQVSLLFVTVLMQAFFANRFLNLEEFAPKIKWLVVALMSFAGIATVFNWITQNDVFAHLANTSLFAVLVGYFFTGITLFSKKNYAKFYVIGSFIPLLFSIDFFVLNPLGIEFLATQTTHIKAAAIAEMLILTYAIMYRMQAIKEEHALRQAEMRIFLKRQEVLSTRQKTEKLVEDVYLENLIMHYDLDGLEIKLLQYISEGKDNAKIARKLKVSENDVEELTKELYDKLEISEQIQQDYRMVDQQPDYIYN